MSPALPQRPDSVAPDDCAVDHVLPVVGEPEIDQRL